MFKTSGRASFLIILFPVSSVLRLCSTFRWCFCPFSPALLLRLLHQRRRLHTKPFFFFFCTQRTFGNYWAFAVFSGPDLIANLSDGLKIMDPGFITCDDIGKLLFVIFWKHLKQLFGHFNPLPLLLISQQMWHPSSRNLSDFQTLLQNKVNRW